MKPKRGQTSGSLLGHRVDNLFKGLALSSLFLLTTLMVKPCWPKTRVGLHALFPFNFGYNDEFRSTLMETLMTYKRNLWYNPVFSRFEPSLTNTLLKRDEPLEILEAFCHNVLAKDVVTLLSVNNPELLGSRSRGNLYVLELAEAVGIPVLSWDAEFTGSPRKPEESLALQIAPTIQHQGRAIFSLLIRYNWTQFAIVTTQAPGYREFVDTMETLAAQSRHEAMVTVSGNGKKGFTVLQEVLVRDASNGTLVKSALSRLQGTDSRIILLHSSSRDSLNILEMAAILGLTGRDYLWILTQSAISVSTRTPPAIPLGTLGITFENELEAMKRAIKNAVKIWFLALLDLSRLPFESNQTMTLPGQRMCNVSGEIYWKDGRNMYKHLRDIHTPREPQLRFDSNGSLLHTELLVWNVQSADSNDSRKWKEVGRWMRTGLMMNDIVWPGRASNPPTGKPLRRMLRVATLDERPYVMYEKPGPEGTCTEHAVRCRVYQRDSKKNRLSNTTMPMCCVGLSVDLLRVFSRELNFDFDFFEVEDGRWGALNKTTDQWNGLIDILLRREADMVVTSLKINPDRARAVTFSVPYLETGITIVVSLREGAISPTAFLEPFDITSWILILMLCIHTVALGVYLFEWLSPDGFDRGDKTEEPYDYPSWCFILVFSVHATGASIFIFEWLSPYGLTRGKPPFQDRRFSLFRSFWLIWAMLFSAAVETDTPKGVSSRFLANIWALFAVVFLASYTANLAAFMITKEEFYDLSGIQDWRLQKPTQMNPPFKYATVPQGSTETNIRYNHPAMFHYMKPFNKPSVDLGIAAVKSGEIQAFIYDATVLEYYTGKDPGCRLRTVGNWYAMTGYGVGFPPGADNLWMSKINEVIFELQRNGEMERLQKFWLAGACYTEKEKKGISNKTLGILNFTSAFILLGGGVLLSVVLLLLEHVYFRFGRRCLMRVDNSGCCSFISLSVGKSLAQRRSDELAVRRRRCQDRVCDTQIWRLRHELDMAFLKIETLQNQINKESESDNPKHSVERAQLHQQQSQQQHREQEQHHSVSKAPHGSDFSQHNGSARRHTLQDASPAQSSPAHLAAQESCDFRSESGSDGMGRLRRSPSYTSAVGDDVCCDDKKLSQKSRYHDGKVYVGVHCTSDKDSIL